MASSAEAAPDSVSMPSGQSCPNKPGRFQGDGLILRENHHRYVRPADQVAKRVRFVGEPCP